MRQLRRVGCTLAIAGTALAGNVGPAAAGQTFGDVFVPDLECVPGLTHYTDSAVPGPGVITSLRYTTGADSLANFQFKVGRLVGPDMIATIAQTPSETLPAATESVRPVQIPVAGGEILGFYYVGEKGASCGDGPTGRVIYYRNGNAQPGTTEVYEAEGAIRVPISAALEPDADKDGFGDESQDRCPTNASTQAACPISPIVVPDMTRPVVSALGFSSSVFRAAKRGPSISAKRRPVGTRVSFSLSEAAPVRFTVQRRTRGRRVAGRCVRATRSNRTRKACVRWVRVRGSFTVDGVAGTIPTGEGRNTFKFRGRIGGKRLRPGGYRLDGQATDTAGNESAVTRKRFRIVS